MVVFIPFSNAGESPLNSTCHSVSVGMSAMCADFKRSTSDAGQGPPSGAVCARISTPLWRAASTPSWFPGWANTGLPAVRLSDNGFGQVQGHDQYGVRL